MRLRRIAASMICWGALTSACVGQISKPGGGSTSPGGDQCEDAGDSAPADEPDAGFDLLSPTRLLRRTLLTLTGHSPTDDQYEQVLNATAAQREALMNRFIDEALASKQFYETSLDFGHEVLRTVEYSVGAAGDAYQGNMSGNLDQCASDTRHPGAFYYWNTVGDNSSVVCNDKLPDGSASVQPVTQVEPWWAPGTTIAVLGIAGRGDVVNPAQPTVDCGAMSASGYYDPYLPSGCSCGPHLIFCYPFRGLSGANNSTNNVQRRHAWEEPARLWAHVIWHDRPLSDVVLGNYSVGTNALRALYVRFGRRSGAFKQTDTLDWFHPQANTPSDPLTAPNDPNAWREFVTESLTPQLLALTSGQQPSGSLERKLVFDPRTTTDGLPGLPAAGVLTMLGSNATFTRERPRGARWLETFACRSFEPPSPSLSFPEFQGDPAKGGPCMHCHRTIDPAAIFFKRWGLEAPNPYVPWPFIPGVPGWRIDAERHRAQYPYQWESLVHWRDTWVPGTVLTPLTAAEHAANPEAYLLDSMRPGETLYGATSDGTVGPLGWAKLIVQSGEFDRCMTRRLYERYVGRPLDPANEGPYLEALSAQFVARGRVVRPFVKDLMKLPEFQRGF